MPRRADLPSIITAARAGSLELAERLFVEGGFADRRGDPAALSVRGRLEKDRALRLPPSLRPAAFAKAAQAYAAADAIVVQPYTRINVATLTLLAGDPAHAQDIARGLLEWLDCGEPIAETPYFIEATRAEAHLLCGEHRQCEAALERALAVDPTGWENHAATLNQFETILSELGEPAGWLVRFRPPRSLHFAGHLGIAASAHEHLIAKVSAIIAEERIGFAFGAIAAGSEIVIAEAAIAAGAELRLVLPGSAQQFAALSVDPYGDDWRERFLRCLNAASEVRYFGQPAAGYQPLGMKIVSDVAMGAAIMNARHLASEAVQLLVCDEGDGPFGSGVDTAQIGGAWTRSGGRQHILREARIAAVTSSGSRATPEGLAELRLVAMLHIAFDGLDQLSEDAFAQVVHNQIDPLRRAIAELAVQPDLVLPAGNARIAAFADPLVAWSFAHAVLGLVDASQLPLRIVGHYGLTHWLDAPPALVGRAVSDLGRIATAVIPGVFTVSEPMACALHLAPAETLHMERVGEAAGFELYTANGPTSG